MLPRFSGFAHIAGGALGFGSSSGVAGYLVISLAPSRESFAVGTALLLGNLWWFLLAVGLLALGIHLLWDLAGNNRLHKPLATLGVGWAAISMAASLVGTVALTVNLGIFEVRPTPPGFVQPFLLDTFNSLVFGGLIVAGVSLGLVLRYTRQIGKWWILPLVLGFLTVPQILGLVLKVILALISNGLSTPPLALALAPDTLVAGSWIILGLLVAFKIKEYRHDPARVV